MFLLDVQECATSLALIFRQPRGEVGMWSLPKKNYIYANPCEPHLNKIKTGHIPGKTVGCAIWGTVGNLTQLYRVATPTSISECSKCETYNGTLDLKTKILYDYGIEVYRYYTYDGNPYVSLTRATELDPTKLRMIMNHESGANWKKDLKIVTVHLTMEHKGEFHPIVPAPNDLISLAMGITPIAVEKRLGLASITSIIVMFENSSKTFKATTRDDEETTIREFLSWFKKVDPDVVQMFNAIQYEYLYHRCRYLKMEGIFVTTMNRMVIPELSKLDYVQRNVPTYYQSKYKCKTNSRLNYNDYSDESTTYTFKSMIVGRILFNYFAIVSQRNVLEQPSVNVEYWHTKFTNQYLPTLLWITGSYHMTADYYTSKLVMSSWILIKEFSSQAQLVFPTPKQKRKFNSYPEDELNEEDQNVSNDPNKDLETDPNHTSGDKNIDGNGGMHFDVKESKLYRKTTEEVAVDLDMSTFYGNIIISCNLDPATVRLSLDRKDWYIFDHEAPKSEPVYGDYAIISKIKGILPFCIESLVEKRTAAKRSKETENSQFEIDSLDQQDKALKLCIATVFGCLRNKHHSNLISAPLVGEAIMAIGREIWKCLRDFLLSKSHEIIHGNTDGMIVYTKHSSNLPDDISQFKAHCLIRCFPEIRRYFDSIYIKDKTTWIGVASNTCKLINKNGIQAHTPEIQIRIELALFNRLLLEQPGRSMIFGMIEDLQEALEDYSQYVDASNPLLYFWYYRSNAPVFQPIFHPMRYEYRIHDNVIRIFNLAFQPDVMNEDQIETLNTLMFSYMPQ